MRLYLTLLALLMGGFAHAQSGSPVPGSLSEPAAPLNNPMDPNGDEWITSSGNAFTGPLDETEFELPYLPIPEYEPEPVPDNQVPSTSCVPYELVGDAASGAESTYYYYQDPDGIPDNGDELIFFRFRIARIRSNSVSLSILIDTDYRFGFSPPLSTVDADPNAVPGNPGFEVEISIESLGQILIYDADGVSNPTVVNSSYSSSSNLQIAYALNQDPDCSNREPGFIDIYLPFSALGVSSTTPIRMVGAGNENSGSALGGNADDIAGVDGNAIASDDDQFIAVIGSFPPFSFGGSTNLPPLCMDGSAAIDENTNDGSAVYTVSASDPDGSVLTYSIIAGNASNAFAINGSGQITVSDASFLDFETTPSFTLTVRVSDGTLFDDATITINLNDINEAPVASDATVSLDENSANATVVHSVSASDPDGVVLTYTITGGNTGTAFAIDGSGLITVNDASVLDFETMPSVTLTVRVWDGTLFDDATTTINLNDINEAPVASDATVSLDENSTNATVVHSVSASDPDGDALTYTITGGNTGTAFAIDGSGQITVNNASVLDFETTPSFTLTVRVSDGTLFDDATTTINLNDINEAPVASDATVSLDENSTNATVVHSVSASDPDGEVLTYTITGGNAGTAFAIDGFGQITVNNSSALDYETTPSFTLILTVTDGTLSDDAVITINLNDLDETPTDVNDAPVVSDATVFLDENSPNSTIVHPVFASDADGDVLTYTIIAGNTNTAFAITSSGQIIVNNTSALDFEATSSFTLTVRVSDGTLSDDAVILISLNNVNESPSADDATIWLDENSATGSHVHQASASDPDGNALTYSITGGNPGNAFGISGSGQITVNNSSALDYETTPSFTLIVTAIDGTLSDDAVIKINLNDLDETPTDVNDAPVVSDATVFLDENSPNSTMVHTVFASDADGDALTYAIIAGNNDNQFAISTDGVISVNNSSAFNFETSSAFALTVAVGDGELSSQANIIVNLRDVNEPPTISDALLKILENTAEGALVYTVVADDPDANDNAVFSIEAGNIGSAFLIGAYTGEVTVNNLQPFDGPGSPSYELLIMVTDVGGLIGTATLTIEIERLDEEIGINPLKGFSPNGDGINDFWLIRGIERFPNNEVKVFNRWGNLVYEARQYNNQDVAWRGERDGLLGGNNTPETTYYFLIAVEGLEPISGYVIMK